MRWINTRAAAAEHCARGRGLGLGATFIAAITDFMFRDGSAIRYSITIAGLVLLPLMVLIILAGMRSDRESLLRVSSGIQER